MSERETPHEPMFNAPWPAVALAVVILGGYALQGWVAEPVVMAYAFAPADLDAGRWETLVTALFLHGSWAHALMNAAFALAFGTPLARFLGTRGLGVVLFFLFYLVCGVLANLGYAAIHPGQPTPLVGASGAVSGLMGAAARLIAGRGELGGVFSRTVLGFGAGWIAVNLILAVVGFAPGAGDAKIAWEAHLAGFFVGVLLIGPVARLARRA